MQARLKPCIKRENINHRACTNEGCSLFLYRAQPVSEMERKARNRAAWPKPDGMEAQPVSEMERKARNRAAWLKPEKKTEKSIVSIQIKTDMLDFIIAEIIMEILSICIRNVV